MARLYLSLLLFVLLPFGAMAQSIEDYVPPPMFGNSAPIVINETYPPLPPRRPLKLKAPQSYVAYMRKHGKAPQLIRHTPQKHIQKHLSEQVLIEPSAQDIFDQINPQ